MVRMRWSGARAGAVTGAVVAVMMTAAPAAGQAGPTVTLEEAVERALEHSPAVAQASGSVESAEWSQRRAGAAYLPSLSVGSSAGFSGSNGIGGAPGLESGAGPGVRESYGAGVSASVDLYTGGRRGAEVSRARAETSAARAALTEREFATILSAQRAFFEVARAADMVAVAEGRLEAAETVLAAAQRRAQVGSATNSDVLRAELEHSRARQSLLEARNQERTATLVLGRTVGADGPVGVTLTDADRTARPLGESVEEIVARIVEGAPSVDAALAAVGAAEAGRRAASSQYLPRLQLSTGYDWNSQAFGFDGSQTGWSVRLGFSLPLFDGFGREASVADARVRQEVAEAQASDAVRAARVEAERLVGNLQVAEERIVLAEEGTRVAEEDLRVQQLRYELNASTMLDQIASQTALAEARQNLVAARYDYQLARAELEALAGRRL